VAGTIAGLRDAGRRREVNNPDMASDDPSPAWLAVDALLESTLGGEPVELREAAARCASAGLPPIAVTPMQGRLLALLTRLVRARRVLEVGTLGGYSTLWLARGLEASGRITTIELDPARAAVAQANFDAAGESGRIELHVGAALDVLPRLSEGGAAPFQLSFIDADKENSAAYFEWAVRLSGSGSVIIVDNVVRAGAILNADDVDASVRGSRRVLEVIGRTPGIASAAIQTVGAKGYDGFAIVLVR
jgi:predicted O-methyltransferase YrrM